MGNSIFFLDKDKGEGNEMKIIKWGKLILLGLFCLSLFGQSALAARVCRCFCMYEGGSTRIDQSCPLASCSSTDCEGERFTMCEGPDGEPGNIDECSIYYTTGRESRSTSPGGEDNDGSDSIPR